MPHLRIISSFWVGFWLFVRKGTSSLSDFRLHLVGQNCATYLSSDQLLAKGNEIPMTSLDQSGFLLGSVIGPYPSWCQSISAHYLNRPGLFSRRRRQWMLGRQQRTSATNINIISAFKNSDCTLNLPSL